MIELQKNVDVQKANEMMKSKLKRNEKKLKDIRGKIEQEKRKKLDDYILLTKGELTEDEFVKRREVNLRAVQKSNGLLYRNPHRRTKR